MAFVSKLRRVLTQEFPPPDRIKLYNGNGIAGAIMSKRFEDVAIEDRIDLILDLLRQHGLSKEEIKEITILTGVTPDEVEAHRWMDEQYPDGQPSSLAAMFPLTSVERKSRP